MSLALGSRGPHVRCLQLLLVTRGIAALVPDGIFGARTRAAVAQAQSRGEEEVTGIADDAFVAALVALPVAHVELPRIRTTLSREQRRHALRAGHRDALAAELSPAAERMALAHLQLEHGTDALWTYNFGNVMTGKNFAGPWFAMNAAELHPYGWKIHRSMWRAYASPEEGAAGYWQLLDKRFPRALTAFDSADVGRVVHELKAAGYMTARERDYAALMRRIWDGIT